MKKTVSIVTALLLVAYPILTLATCLQGCPLPEKDRKVTVIVADSPVSRCAPKTVVIEKLNEECETCPNSPEDRTESSDMARYPCCVVVLHELTGLSHDPRFADIDRGPLNNRSPFASPSIYNRYSISLAPTLGVHISIPCNVMLC